MRYLKGPKALAIVVGFIIAVMGILAWTSYDVQAGDPVPVLYVGCDGYTWSGSPNIINAMNCKKLRIGSECLYAFPIAIVDNPDPMGFPIVQYQLVEAEGACE